MQTIQQYRLTINDLFAISGGVLCGATAEVAIMDGDAEIYRLKLTGKLGPGGAGYCRGYTGKPGLTAKIVDGPGTIRLHSDCGN